MSEGQLPLLRSVVSNVVGVGKKHREDASDALRVAATVERVHAVSAARSKTLATTVDCLKMTPLWNDSPLPRIIIWRG